MAMDDGYLLELTQARWPDRDMRAHFDGAGQ